jgi:hypothetical protein
MGCKMMRPAKCGHEWLKRNAAAAVLLLAGIAAAGSAGAINFEICVQSDADLTSALDQARSVAVAAKIVQHKLTSQNAAYDLKNSVWHSGVASGTQPGTELLGGYTAGCAACDIAVGNTRITDSGASPYDLTQPCGDLTIEGLTFSMPNGLNIRLGSVYNYKIASGSTILFRRNAFVDANDGGLVIIWDQAADRDSTIRVVGTLIANYT